MARASVGLRRQAGALRTVPMAGMVAAAKITKQLAATEASRAVPGGVMHLPRKGKPDRRVKLRSRDDIRQVGHALVRCRVQALPVGPWVWIDSGTRPHQLGRLARGGRRPRRGTYGPQRPGTGARLQLGRDWVTGPLHHPGSRGRRAWAQVVDQAHEVLPQVFSDQVEEALHRG